MASTAQLAADPSSADTAKRFGAVPTILEAIRQWESARMSGAFPPTVRTALRDNTREFHLQAVPEGGWTLQDVHPVRFTHDANQSQPTEFRLDPLRPGQTLQWIVRASGKEPIPALRIEFDGRVVADLNETALPAGGSLKYGGGTAAIIADSAWKEVGRVPVALDGTAPSSSTPASIRISCAQVPGASLKAELRVLDPGTRIGR